MPIGRRSRGVHVGVAQQLAAHDFARATLEQHVVRHHHRRAAVLLQNRPDALHEVELLVAGAGPEIGAIDGQRFATGLARVVDDGDTALLAERRIGQHDVVLAVLLAQRIAGDHRQLLVGFAADAVQQQVKRAQAGDTVHQLHAVQRSVLQLLLFRAIQLVVLHEVIVRGHQEAVRTLRHFDATRPFSSGNSESEWEHPRNITHSVDEPEK